MDSHPLALAAASPAAGISAYHNYSGGIKVAIAPILSAIREEIENRLSWHRRGTAFK
jgi:hypothetical protein